ncbi:MAG: radical SAM protein [Methanotrichaceae archaeon]|nr:radical SAM protein [Methanotrichaceae archaeon]
MKVNLGGLVYLSTVDWMGRAAMVIFLRGCPLRCPQCQNKALQNGEQLVEISYIKEEIKKIRCFMPTSEQVTLEEACLKAAERPLISALVFSGGEPLMQPNQVVSLARTAKSLRLKTGLETCGYFPNRILRLLTQDVIDKVFLDIKASFHDPEYENATGMAGVALKVKESLSICMKLGIPLEVRTTVFPNMPSPSEVFEIAEALLDLKFIYPENRLESFVIQQGRPRDAEVQPICLENLKSLAESLKDRIDVRVRCSPKFGIDL